MIVFATNVNDMVTVRLTEHGLKILRERDPVCARYNLTGSTLRAQLWTLMHVFGDQMTMAAPACFVDNRLEIESSLESGSGGH
jgi:hypothetical protein